MLFDEAASAGQTVLAAFQKNPPFSAGFLVK
jgi:hypothetical protein